MNEGRECRRDQVTDWAGTAGFVCHSSNYGMRLRWSPQSRVEDLPHKVEWETYQLNYSTPIVTLTLRIDTDGGVWQVTWSWWRSLSHCCWPLMTSATSRPTSRWPPPRMASSLETLVKHQLQLLTVVMCTWTVVDVTGKTEEIFVFKMYLAEDVYQCL